MKKKIVAFIMAFALAAGSAGGLAGPVTVWAQEGQEQVTEDGFRYEIREDGISITGYSGDSAELVIPSEIDGKRVTGIKNFAFKECGSLTSVTIPESVTSIGGWAFVNCSGLTSVTIPNGVTGIGEYAFRDCSGLKSIIIPESVTSIGMEAFSRCSGLTGIDVAEGNKTYVSEEGVLYNKAKTELICCPGGKQGSVTIPESVTSIWVEAFSRCGGLTGIDVAEGNETYASEEGALYNKAKTELICCPGGKQGSVTISGSVTSIGFNAFSVCGGLTGIDVAEENETYASEEGALYNKAKTELICCPGGKRGSVTIPGSVKSIRKYAFESCSGLTSVTIPGSVKSIGVGTFSGCSGLTSVTIPGSVKSIFTWAFFECDKLKDVYYGGSQAQWGQISISGAGNEALQSAVIHYNPSGPSDGSGGNNEGSSGGNNGGNNGGSGSVPVQKTAQTITASDLVKTYGAKAFSLGAKSSGNGALSYMSSNPKVAAVDGSGKVTVKGCGITDIVITAAETDTCAMAQKTVKLTVKPKKAALVSVKSKKKKTITAKWKKDGKASGYLIECATDKKFKKNKVKAEAKKNKTVTATVKKLKGGKKYYVRVCAYAKSGKTKIQGDWSKARTVKVKK